MSVEELLATLDQIMNDNGIDALGDEVCLNWGLLEERDKIVQDATHLANLVLIKDDGERNIENEIKIKIAGYGVFALEQDGCGWLLGGILTPKGIISYG
jgi:hypothetical protein